GKCSNPNGHGHNYEVEVQVATHDARTPLSILALDAVVDTVLIDRFDHKHLNLDVDDFQDRVASVENIALRCVELLREPISALSSDSELHAVKVWETPRTACTVMA
ncbi:MAG: 6-carboxytetrahydropterin synthase, partial [Phycisphaerales bacterium]